MIPSQVSYRVCLGDCILWLGNCYGVEFGDRDLDGVEGGREGMY